jgi:hypothetical protein
VKRPRGSPLGLKTRLFGLTFEGIEANWVCVSPPVVEKALEDEGGGYLVDDGAMLRSGSASLIQNVVRFAGGEALVPQVDGQAREFGETGGKGLGFGGLGTGRAGQMKRVADHNSGDVEAAGEAGERTHVFTGIAAPLKGEHGLRSEPQLVGERDTNAAIADVETEEAGLGSGLQWFAPISAYIPLARHTHRMEPDRIE